MGKKGQFLPGKLGLRNRILALILLLELGIFPYSFPKSEAKLVIESKSMLHVASITSVTHYPEAVPTVYGSIFPPQLPVVTPTKTPAKPRQVHLAAVPRIQKVAPEVTLVLIEKYGQEYGVDPGLLKQIAACESGYRTEAANGPYGGMYQFLASTWASNRKAMGASPDPNLRFDAEEAIKTAAFKISRDGAGAWPVCGKTV